MNNNTKSRELRKRERTEIKPGTRNGARFAVMYPIEKFQELLSDEFQTTAQIRRLMGCSVDLAYLRLNQLVQDGKATKTPAGNIWLWKRVNPHGRS